MNQALKVKPNVMRECLKLRVKDVDFGYRQITVRDGKGGKDRMTMLPAVVIEPLRSHLARVQALHERVNGLDERFESTVPVGRRKPS